MERNRHVVVVIIGHGGQSLLETLVALAILAVGIVAVLHAFSTSLIATKEAETYSIAAILANEVASNLDSQTTITSGQQTGTFDDASNYAWSANIHPADSNGLMQTSISVTWADGNNPRQYNMVIYLRSSSTGTTDQSTAGSSTSSGGT